MLYAAKCKITKEFIRDVENIDEILTRQVIMTLVRDIPLEDLKKLFNYKILDPDSESAKEIMADLKADSSLKQKILRMREERTLEASAYIEI